VPTSLKIAIVAETSFAVLLGLFALPGAFDGDTAPARLQAGFIGCALFAAVIAAGLVWRPRAAAIAGIIFALIYIVPGTVTFASTALWSATSYGLARSMLMRFGGALAAQLVALGALWISGAWKQRAGTSVDRAAPAS
jgi:hypothetical protein